MERTRLILVRHGETEANVQGVWHGALDAPLTARGRMQVSATARRVAVLASDRPVDRFFVSPLARAQSTAAAIASAIERRPIVDMELREFDLGAWEGRSFQELREFEDLWGRWKADPTFAPPDGESPRSFHARAVGAVRRLAEHAGGETVLIVTHGGVICNVLATWFGGGPDDWRRWEPHNCALSVVEWDGQEWRPVLLNDISHLPPEAVVASDAAAYLPVEAAARKEQ